MALFYGWLGSTFAPVLVMLTAAETVTAELGSGSARFALVRTDGLLWVTGKLLGQTLMMAVSLMLGGMVCLLVAWIQLDSFDAGATASWIVALSGRASLMGFAHVGLALGLSQCTRSIAVARALGLGSLGVMGALHGISNRPWAHDRAPVTVDTLRNLLPRAHQLDLWRPEFNDRLPAMVMLVALGVLYFAAGFVFRTRRDQ